MPQLVEALHLMSFVTKW